MSCSVKENLVSCQIAYYPIGSAEYLDEIDDVLQVIKNTGLEYSMNEMSTTVKGEASKVIGMIVDLQREMTQKGYEFTMNILLSNVCGCKK